MSETSLMKVGVVGVDSGRIMLLDPCYEGKVRINEIATDIGIADVRHVESAVNLGIVAQTGVGDGLFPVIAEIVDGKLNGLLLDFGDDDLEKGILGARMIARGEEAPEIVGPVEPELTDEQRDQLRYIDGWQGTPPAQGSRRKLILDTLEDFSARLISGVGGKLTGGSCLDAADAIEEALLRVVDQGATPESGSPASVAMDLLDRFDVPRTREGAILTIADRVTVLADELVETRRERDVKQATLEGLAATVTAQADALEKRVDGLAKLTSRTEGTVPPSTTDLVVVLEDVSDPDGPPEYRFIELENQDGRGIGAFPIRSSERPPFKEIVIPYGRDDGWVSEVAYQAAGAATRPLLEDHPDYVFPAERVRDAVAELLSDFGIPRACVDCAEEQLGHGAKEVDQRRDATIKQLEADVERFLREREEARSGESRFAEERDCAFALLRWLLPVTVAKRID